MAIKSNICSRPQAKNITLVALSSVLSKSMKFFEAFNKLKILMIDYKTIKHFINLKKLIIIFTVTLI